eukprot:7389677-Prymnesium_polylepis.2
MHAAIWPHRAPPASPTPRTVPHATPPDPLTQPSARDRGRDGVRSATTCEIPKLAAPGRCSEPRLAAALPPPATRQSPGRADG